MNLGVNYLVAVCLEGESYPFVKSQLMDDFFPSDFEKSLFLFIKDFVEKYASLPSIKILNEKFGTLEVPSAKSAFYYDQLREHYLYRLMNKGLYDCNDLVKEKKFDKLIDHLQKLIVQGHKVLNQLEITDFGEEAYSILLSNYHKQSIQGRIDFGWEFLDGPLGGMLPGDFISIVGRPMMGKSYLSAYIANNAWWKQKKNVLLVSMEMLALPLMQRLIAIHTGLPIDDIKTGTLPNFPINLEEKFKQSLLEMHGYKSRLIIVNGNLAATPVEIFSLASNYSPDLIIIDGAYLLKHENRKLDRFSRVAENAELLKQLTTKAEIPVLCSYQFNRESTKKKNNSEEIEDIGYSDVIGQISSISLGVLEEDSVSGLIRKVIKLMKMREQPKGSFKINWDFLHMNFTEAKENIDQELEYL